MPTWVIQHVEARAMCDGWYLSDGKEPMLIDRFTNKNDFAAALHEGGIAGMVQVNNEQNDVNDNDNRITYEDPNKPPGIVLEPAAACGKIAGVPPQ